MFLIDKVDKRLPNEFEKIKFTEDKLNCLFNFMSLSEITNLGLVDRNLAKKIFSIRTDFKWVHHASCIFSLYVQRKFYSETKHLSFPYQGLTTLAERLGASLIPSAIHQLILKPCETELSDVLEQMPHLHTLHVSRHHPQDLIHLKKCLALQVLQFDSAAQITDSVLPHLSGLFNLQDLGLIGCDITDEGLKILSTLKLQKCTLHCCKITDRGLEAINSGLKYLNFSSNNITETCQSLSRFTLLEELVVSCSNMNDMGLHALKNLTNLKILTFNQLKNITDAGIVSLESLTRLQKLNLLMIPIKGSCLSTLRELIYLKHLRLSSCLRLNDAALHHLNGFNHLQTLDLSSLEISNAGLKIISMLSLPQLQTIDFSDCKKLTEVGIEHLTALPKLHTIVLKKTWVDPSYMNIHALRSRQQAAKGI